MSDLVPIFIVSGWGGVEPNGHEERCTVLYWESWTWIDTECENPAKLVRPLCEKQREPDQTPPI